MQILARLDQDFPGILNATGRCISAQFGGSASPAASASAANADHARRRAAETGECSPRTTDGRYGGTGAALELEGATGTSSSSPTQTRTMCSCKCFCRRIRASAALSWRNYSSMDYTIQPCPPSPHPFTMCKSEAEAFGYPCEDHKVTTEDGHILSLKRIPHGPHGRSDGDNLTKKRRPPVLLFHGLMVDGVSWLLGTPKQSIGFILVDNGFDVWLANTRGTNSSRNHTSLSPKDPAFWDWSWDQLAEYDLPAMLQFVYDHTGGQKVHYIGHSLGTLMILAAFSEQKLLHVVRSTVLLCPIAYLSRTRSKLARVAAQIFLAEAAKWLGFHEFNPVGPIAHKLLLQVCGNRDVDCIDLFSAFAGPDCCLNTTTTCAFLQHAPQPTSIKNLVHLSQMVRSEGVRRYDYGNVKDNMKHYNQPRPPLYNLSSIPTHVPMFLTHGGQDFLGDVPDTRRLLRTLVRRHDNDNIEVLYVPDYAHADFVIGYNVPQLVYKPMVDFFNRH